MRPISGRSERRPSHSGASSEALGVTDATQRTALAGRDPPADPQLGHARELGDLQVTLPVDRGRITLTAGRAVLRRHLRAAADGGPHPTQLGGMPGVIGDRAQVPHAVVGRPIEIGQFAAEQSAERQPVIVVGLADRRRKGQCVSEQLAPEERGGAGDGVGDKQ